MLTMKLLWTIPLLAVGRWFVSSLEDRRRLHIDRIGDNLLTRIPDMGRGVYGLYPILEIAGAVAKDFFFAGILCQPVVYVLQSGWETNPFSFA